MVYEILNWIQDYKKIIFAAKACTPGKIGFPIVFKSKKQQFSKLKEELKKVDFYKYL